MAAALQGLVPTDAVQAGKIKSYERIVNKMFSRGDHRHATKPRPARNIDVVRCIASFEDPKLMLEVSLGESALCLQATGWHFGCLCSVATARERVLRLLEFEIGIRRASTESRALAEVQEWNGVACQRG